MDCNPFAAIRRGTNFEPFSTYCYTLFNLFCGVTNFAILQVFEAVQSVDGFDHRPGLSFAAFWRRSAQQEVRLHIGFRSSINLHSEKQLPANMDKVQMPDEMQNPPRRSCASFRRHLWLAARARHKRRPATSAIWKTFFANNRFQ